MRKSWTLSLITLVTAALGVTPAGVTPASATSTTPLRGMPLGDSITWGVGSSTDNGYRGPLWDKLAADGHPLDFVGTLRGGSMSDPDNEGHSGYRIDQIAALADDVNGGNTADGTAVQIWSCSDSANQLWSTYTDGTLRSMGKCLDAAGGGTANGTKVQIWACHGGANQVWQPYNGGYRNPTSGRCLDDPGVSTTDGTQLQLWDCNGGSNQKWTTLTAG
ncbi:ricin-type beta-trefoil lectin domain protein [Streptomyces sp. NPDC056704]|uniref:ricin-type beta-trefoil lectin domain protein n=1 Tax=Streptomyces TaxID=1883 RepID=UPI00369D6DD5